MYKVLIVEDDLEVREIIKHTLAPLSLQVFTSAGLAAAEHKLQSEFFDLFLLDLGLLDGDGLNLLSHIRQMPQYKQTPIFILTSKADVVFKLSAFSLGADDYITKPFNCLELKARIERALGRLAGQHEAEDHLFAGPFLFEIQKQIVRVKNLEEQILLTSTEFRILLLLARHPEVIFSRNQILDHVWGDAVAVTDRTVDSHIYTLRKKLGCWSNHIQSAQGQGYRFLESASLRRNPNTKFEDVKNI